MECEIKRTVYVSLTMSGMDWISGEDSEGEKELERRTRTEMRNCILREIRQRRVAVLTLCYSPRLM